jgi:hypothetical protein
MNIFSSSVSLFESLVIIQKEEHNVKVCLELRVQVPHIPPSTSTEMARAELES